MSKLIANSIIIAMLSNQHIFTKWTPRGHPRLC